MRVALITAFFEGPAGGAVGSPTGAGARASAGYRALCAGAEGDPPRPRGGWVAGRTAALPVGYYTPAPCRLGWNRLGQRASLLVAPAGRAVGCEPARPMKYGSSLPGETCWALVRQPTAAASSRGLARAEGNGSLPPPFPPHLLKCSIGKPGSMGASNASESKTRPYSATDIEKFFSESLPKCEDANNKISPLPPRSAACGSLPAWKSSLPV